MGDVKGSAEARRDLRARAFPEAVCLLRGLVAAAEGRDWPELRAAMAWLEARCKGCGVALEGRARACSDCRATWRENGGKAA